MKVEEPRIDPEDRGAEKAAALGRMIRELVASEARKKAAAEVEEEETDDDEERMKVEMAIENMQKEKPVRFSSKQLAAYTRNYSTKLGSGGFGEVYKAEFPNGPELNMHLQASSISNIMIIINNNHYDHHHHCFMT